MKTRRSIAAFAATIAILIISGVSISRAAETGDDLMAKGKTRAAIKAYENELKSKPGDTDLLVKLAEACDKDGWYGKSFGYWEQAAAKFKSGKRADHAKKQAAMARRWVAVSYYDTGMQLDWTLMHLDKAIELDPGLFDAHYWKGRVLYEKGDLKAALPPLEAALKVKPDNKEAKWLRDTVKGGLSNGSAAYKAYTDAFNLYDKKKFDEALEMYHKAVEENPKFAAAYSWIGRINMEKGNYAEAALNYEKTLKLEPENKRAAWFLKSCRESMGKNNQSQKTNSDKKP